MAAKHDAKKARANFWVMQQNLAKQKGGRPGFQFSEKKAPVLGPRDGGGPAKPAVVPARTEAANAHASATDDGTSAAATADQATE